VLTVTATRRPRAGRADVKCSAPVRRAWPRAWQQVVRLARHTEARHRQPRPGRHQHGPPRRRQERDWELAWCWPTAWCAACWPAPAVVLANGWSDAWQLGRVDGHDVAARRAAALLGGDPAACTIWCIDRPARSGAACRARAPGSRCTAAASTTAWAGSRSAFIRWRAARQGAADEDSHRRAGPGRGAPAGGAPGAGRRAPFRRRGQGRWRTTVRFGPDGFQGNSFELALVLADRLARGREFVPRGRIIASGCSSAWHAGRVDTVEGLAPKCALIAARGGGRATASCCRAPGRNSCRPVLPTPCARRGEPGLRGADRDHLKRRTAA
jgi:hypothetical protein